MSINETINALVQDEMERTGSSMSAVAARMKLEQSTLYRVCHGGSRGPKMGTLKKIASHYGISVDSLDGPIESLLPSSNSHTASHEPESPSNDVGVSMGSNVVRLKEPDETPEEGYIRMELLSAKPSAGRGGVVPEVPYVVRHLDVLEAWARRKLNCSDPRRVRLMTSVGDSMEPKIKNDDIVFVDLQQNFYASPGIYVLTINDRLLIKRLSLSVTGDLSVISDNKDYETERVPASDIHAVNITGKVVGWWTLQST